MKVGTCNAGQLELSVASIRWPGGAREIPRDCPRCDSEDNTDATQLMITGILIGVALLMLGALLVHRIRRHKEHVKQFLISFFNHEVNQNKDSAIAGFDPNFYNLLHLSSEFTAIFERQRPPVLMGIQSAPPHTLTVHFLKKAMLIFDALLEVLDIISDMYAHPCNRVMFPKRASVSMRQVLGRIYDIFPQRVSR